MLKKFCLILVSTLSVSVFANNIHILDAEKAIRAGAPLSDYSDLKAHPLYPYLQYRAYRENLITTNPSQIVLLLNQYPNAPFAGWLAEHAFPLWLSTGNTKAIIAAYHPDLADESIECQYRLALLQTVKPKEAAKNIDTLWLSKNSIESACDPLFRQLMAQGVINQELLLKRFNIAMEANKSGVAKAISRYLDNRTASAANTWLSVDNGSLPLAELLNVSYPAIRSAALGIEVRDKAAKQTEEAYTVAKQALTTEAFLTHKDQGRAFNRLTRILADNDDSRAIDTWQAIPEGEHEANTIFDIIAYTQRLNQWSQLANRLLTSLSNDDLERAEVQYWIAKSYEKTGQPAKAKEHYQKAASKRDFFGFLAAEKLDQRYQMNDHSIAKNPNIYQRVISRPEAYRMQIWLNLGQKERAAQEYSALIRGLNDEELKQAALFAHEQQWPIQGIITLTKIKYWDGLNVRFPTLYEPQVRQLAKQYQLSPATIYAIIRKESIFQPEIKSPAGALGLMQIMPATAADTAKKYGIAYAGTFQLTDINTNLRIGSQYLHDRLQEFGHLAYAAAAYNAGPHRVNNWLAEHPGLPVDEWIAQIPFHETRDYVKRVLEYEKIYEYLLGLPQQPFSSQAIRPY